MQGPTVCPQLAAARPASKTLENLQRQVTLERCGRTEAVSQPVMGFKIPQLKAAKVDHAIRRRWYLVAQAQPPDRVLPHDGNAAPSHRAATALPQHSRQCRE